MRCLSKAQVQEALDEERGDQEQCHHIPTGASQPGGEVQRRGSLPQHTSQSVHRAMCVGALTSSIHRVSASSCDVPTVLAEDGSEKGESCVGFESPEEGEGGEPGIPPGVLHTSKQAES